jgi:hypothetical protein
MKKRKFMSFITPCFICLLLFAFLAFANLHASDKNMPYLFLRVFKGSDLTFNILPFFLIEMVPSILVLYVFSGVFLADYETNYVYVFTRVGSKQKWLIQKTLELLFKIMLTYALAFAAAFVLGVFSGFSDKVSSSEIYIKLFLFQSLTMFFMIFLENFLSLSLGRTKSFLIFMILYFSCTTLTTQLANTNTVGNIVASLLPSSSQMYFWHCDSPQIQNLSDGQSINGFTSVFSFVWLTICFAVSYLICSIVLNKKDLIALVKGESE